MRDTVSNYQRISTTNITIFSGVKKNEDGKPVPDELWQSEAYDVAAKKYKK